MIRELEAEIEGARRALEDLSIATNAAELFARQENLNRTERNLDALIHRWEELEAKK
jgi:ubiquinone biosynthesis protein UbiJ